jgi:DNA-binding transcriptional MerR regulator
MSATFRSGALAARTGVSVDTLRHYEAVGVLPAPRRSPNGYREYPVAAIARGALVRRAVARGFSLRELAAVLRARDAGGSPCRRVRALAGEKLVRMEAELADLAARCAAWRRTLVEWDAQLARTARGGQARLLDRLEEGPRASTRRRGAT